MIHRPDTINPFEFAVLSGLRAAQLMKGCTPRLAGSHKTTTMAQMEVADGKVVRADEATGGPAAVLAARA